MIFHTKADSNLLHFQLHSCGNPSHNTPGALQIPPEGNYVWSDSSTEAGGTCQNECIQLLRLYWKGSW